MPYTKPWHYFFLQFSYTTKAHTQQTQKNGKIIFPNQTRNKEVLLILTGGLIHMLTIPPERLESEISSK